MEALLVPPVLGATAYVLGRLLLRRLAFAGLLEEIAVCAALGLVGLAQAGWVLGMLGGLSAGPVLGLAIAVHGLGVPVWRESLRRVRGARPDPPALLAGGVAAAPFLLLSVYPPIGFDATLYHLPFARAFAQTGGLPFLPDLRMPVFPAFQEVLFAEVMLFAPDTAAHGVQLLQAFLAAALVAVWARQALPERVAGWPTAAIAAGLLLGSPLWAHLAASAYIDAGLALFVTAGLHAANRWFRAAGRGGAWLALAAAFAGAAAASKYLGLFFVGVVGLAALAAPAASMGARLRRAVLVAAVAAVVALPWYGRIVAFTGNPVFPFFPQVFGASEWDPVRFETLVALGDEARPETPAEHAVALARRAVLLARLPWDLSVGRERYGGLPPFSPVWLLVLPAAVLLALRDRRVRLLLILAAAYAFLCLSLPRDSRYFVAALPPLAVTGAAALAWLLARLAPGRRRAAALAVAAVCFLPGWLYAGWRAARLGPPPVTDAQRDRFLAEQIPLYPAVAFLNRAHGSGYAVWGLHAERMRGYADGRFLGDWSSPASFARVLAAARQGGPAGLHRELSRHGVDHLLIPKEMAGKLPFPEGGPEFERFFRRVYEDEEARVWALRKPLTPSASPPSFPRSPAASSGPRRRTIGGAPARPPRPRRRRAGGRGRSGRAGGFRPSPGAAGRGGACSAPPPGARPGPAARARPPDRPATPRPPGAEPRSPPASRPAGPPPRGAGRRRSPAAGGCRPAPRSSRS